MHNTELRYVIYQNIEGLLKEPKSHWSNDDLMFNNWFDSMEDALQAIQNEPNAPSTLIVLPVAVRYWE